MYSWLTVGKIPKEHTFTPNLWHRSQEPKERTGLYLCGLWSQGSWRQGRVSGGRADSCTLGQKGQALTPLFPAEMGVKEERGVWLLMFQQLSPSLESFETTDSFD